MNQNGSHRARAPWLAAVRWSLSILMGLAFSLSVYNYLLVEFFPPTSKRMYVLLPVLAVIGSLGYALLLSRWMLPVWVRMKPAARWLSAALAVLLGVFLLLAGTEAVKESPGSTIILLPDRSVQVSAAPEQSIPEPEVVLLYFKTAAGEVPFSALQYEGWTQKGNQLVLTDFSSNSLGWRGKPGEQAAFIFQRSPRGGIVEVEWGGFTETVNLRFERQDKYTYLHEYPVPAYASNAAVLLLAAANFVMLSLALVLGLWSKRELFPGALSESIRPLPGREESTTPADPVKSRRPAVYMLLLLASMGLALLLRSINLDEPYVYIDELAHLTAAKQILAGSPLGAVYQRGLFLVTLPVALFMKLFGAQVWAAKLPGVIFNVLAIIPLYLLVEKADRRAAILSCLLYASSPWMIGVSRSIREYAFYPFYFYWIVYFMVSFLERLPRRLVILRDWRQVVHARNAGLLLALALPLVYAIAIDWLSTFRTILIVYPVFLLFIALRLDFLERSNVVLALAAAVGLIIFALVYQQRHAFIDFIPVLDTYPLRYFFPNPPQQWYFERLAILFALAFAACIAAGVVLYRRNFVVAFLAALFLVSILVFMLFFSRFFRPRYLINVQFWFIPVMGLGFAMAWRMLRSVFSGKRLLGVLLLVLVFAAGINLNQVLLPSSYAQPGVMPVTDEYQYNFGKVEQLLISESKPGDVLVGSLYGIYADWRGAPALPIFAIDLRFGQQAQTFIYKLVKQYDSGWIVLDDRYDRGDWPEASFNRGNKRIEYVGSLDDQLVYRWYIRR